MGHRLIAEISLAGICLDVFGGMYLAYDLLGGRYGPLRLLTRAVTYSLVFGVGYGLGLGLFFGVASGLATGITVAIELQRTAHRGSHYPLKWEVFFSAIRSAAFGAGVYRIGGLRFALAFAALIWAGQAVAYWFGVRPGLDYSASRRPRLTRRHLRTSMLRTLGYIATAMICSTMVRHIEHAWAFALRVGLVTGVVTTVGILVNPFIEYYADNLPEKRLGVFGIVLVFCGFLLQSVQYWLPILDVPVV
ncbi:MAG: hypothetical protein KGN84_21520 [Acidobacteriota bacterium]|nr:hypothetical protein [Acidobacteriota bacterium]